MQLTSHLVLFVLNVAAQNRATFYMISLSFKTFHPCIRPYIEWRFCHINVTVTFLLFIHLRLVLGWVNILKRGWHQLNINIQCFMVDNGDKIITNCTILLNNSFSCIVHCLFRILRCFVTNNLRLLELYSIFLCWLRVSFGISTLAFI